MAWLGLCRGNAAKFWNGPVEKQTQKRDRVTILNFQFPLALATYLQAVGCVTSTPTQTTAWSVIPKFRHETEISNKDMAPVAFEPLLNVPFSWYTCQSAGRQHSGALRTCNDPKNGNPQNVSNFLKLPCTVYFGEHHVAVIVLLQPSNCVTVWIEMEIRCFEQLTVVPRT